MTGPPEPIPLEEALERLLVPIEPLVIEQVPVDEAAGRHLADDLVARRTQPVTDLSAMDGYAIRLDDLVGPWRIVGESAAGHPFHGTFSTGEAIRISTGAHMPFGDMAVLLQENVTREDDRIALNGKSEPTPRHIRRAGYDFETGQILLRKGSRMGAQQLALAIGAGHADLSVHALPSLAIIDSGDELGSTPDSCANDQIPATNGTMLAAMAGTHVREVRRLGPVPDSLKALDEALWKAGDCDVIVTTGGASVGDHDLVRPALVQWGATIEFWRVAIKPGKPLMVGRKGSQIILGLPGNPGSAFVTAFLFLIPLLCRLSGSAQPQPQPVRLRTSQTIGAGHKRREFLRAIYYDGKVEPLGQQDSGGLLALASANALIDRPAEAEEVKAGTYVPAYLLGNGGIA